MQNHIESGHGSHEVRWKTDDEIQWQALSISRDQKCSVDDDGSDDYENGDDDE